MRTMRLPGPLDDQNSCTKASSCSPPRLFAFPRRGVRPLGRTRTHGRRRRRRLRRRLLPGRPHRRICIHWGCGWCVVRQGIDAYWLRSCEHDGAKRESHDATREQRLVSAADATSEAGVAFALQLLPLLPVHARHLLMLHFPRGRRRPGAIWPCRRARGRLRAGHLDRDATTRQRRDGE